MEDNHDKLAAPLCARAVERATGAVMTQPSWTLYMILPFERERNVYLLTAACLQEKDLPYAILSNWRLGQTAAQSNFVPTPLQSNVSAHVFTLKHPTCSWHLCCVELGTLSSATEQCGLSWGSGSTRRGKTGHPAGYPACPIQAVDKNSAFLL